VPDFNQYLSRRLTALQTTVLIVALAILSGLGYLAYNYISAKLFEARVQTTMPRLCNILRTERQTLVAAIGAYKARYGVYPPDAVVSRQPLVVDPVKNPLLYELAGVIYNPTNNQFTASGMEATDAQYVKTYFHADGFKNCGENTAQVRHFIPVYPSQVWQAVQLHSNPDVFALGLYMPYDEIAPQILWEFNVSSWRYVSTSPTNNPAGYDLWIELRTKDRTITIGNWPAVE
jgi:hypothetical protein